MNEDVQNAIRDIQARQEAGQRARSEFTRSWRRLKAYRDGIAQELSRSAPPRLAEDADALFEEMVGGIRAAAAAAARDAREAADALAAHGQARMLARISPLWHARRRELAAAARHAAAAQASLDGALASRTGLVGF